MTRKAAFLFLFSILAGFAGSRLVAESEQTYPVSWDTVAGAGGYRIELQNSRGDTLLSKIVGKGVLQFTFRLQPGSYRFRVTTLSLAMLDEGATQWFPVVVEAPAAPQIAGVRPREFSTDKDQVVTITGRHFTKQIKAQLIAPDGKKSVLQVRNVSLASMQILVPSLAQAGNYGILLMNGDAFTTIETKALVVSYPAPVFGSLKPAEIRLGVDQASFSAQADNLAASAQVVVSRGGGDPSVAADRLSVTAAVSTGRLDVGLDPATAAGDYDVYVINHAAEAPAFVGRIRLLPVPPSVVTQPAAAEPTVAPQTAAVEPVAAPAEAAAATGAEPLPNFPASEGPSAPPAAAAPGHRFLAGLGWSYGLPLTSWGGIYGPTPLGALLRLDYFLAPFDAPSTGSRWDFALGFDARYVGFSNVVDSSLVPSSLASFSVALDPSATWSLHALSVRARLGVGLAYSRLSSTSPASGTASMADSLDLLASGELGVEFPIVPRARLGLAFDYERLFLTQGMDLLGISTYASFAYR